MPVIDCSRCPLNDGSGKCSPERCFRVVRTTPGSSVNDNPGKSGIETKTSKDGFVWLVINREQARKLWEADVFTLYTLYNDGSEGMIETEEKLEDTIRKGLKIGIEIGFLSELSKFSN